MSLVDVPNDLLANMFHNLYDMIQLKSTCSLLHSSLEISHLLMIAKLRKVHLLKSIYNKLPCWKSAKMRFAQRTHIHQLFTFQVGCNLEPVRIQKLSDSQLYVDFASNYDILMQLCHNINKASNNSIHIFDNPKLYLEHNGVSHCGEHSGNLKSCLHYHLESTEKKLACLILSIHVSMLHPIGTPLLTKPYLYFVVHESLVF
tara:strand:+ start:1487 stop:2092 length:606 start_codon:yes stop_codon:yes gene_type:complete